MKDFNIAKPRCQSRHLYATVREILENQPDARSSDKKLIVKVYQKLGVNTKEPFDSVIFSAPSIESITRAGRRARSKFPNLCGCENVEQERILSEEAYKKWAKTI